MSDGPTENEVSSTEHAVFDSHRYHSWIIKVFPFRRQSFIVFEALVISLAVFVLGYLISLFDPENSWYLSDPTFYLGSLGLFFELIILAQWSRRYIDMWARFEAVFANDQQRYTERIHSGLKRIYNRYTPFVLFLGYHVFVTVFYFGPGPFDLHAAIRFIYVTFLNFLAIVAIYSFYAHVVLIRDILRLEISDDIGKAADELKPLADFSLIICVNWFLALSVLVVYFGNITSVQTQVPVYLTDLLETVITTVDYVALAQFGYIILIFFLLCLGLLVFFIPVWLVHVSLQDKKKKRIDDIDQDYLNKIEEWDNKSITSDQAIDDLDVLERKRQYIVGLGTWPYDLPTLVKLVTSAVIPTLLLLIEFLLFVRGLFL